MLSNKGRDKHSFTRIFDDYLFTPPSSGRKKNSSFPLALDFAGNFIYSESKTLTSGEFDRLTVATVNFDQLQAKSWDGTTSPGW